MSRVDFFRDLGLDVETAVILDDELSSLPERTQRVFEMRAQGYTREQIESAGVCPGGSVWIEMQQCIDMKQIIAKRPKIRAYSYEGEVVSDYS